MAMKKQSKAGNLTKNASQPKGGHGGHYVKPAHQKSETKTGSTKPLNGYGAFTPPAASGACRFPGTKGAGVLRTSGSGHRVGGGKKK